MAIAFGRNALFKHFWWFDWFRRILSLNNKNGANNKGPNNNKRGSSGILIPLTIIGILALFGIFIFGNSKILNGKTKYYEVLSHYQKNEVLESTLEFTTGNLRYILKKEKNKIHTYKVPSVRLFLKAVDKIVRQNNSSNFYEAKDVINYVRGRDFSWILSIAPSLLGVLIMVMWFVFILKFQGGGASRIGKFGKNSLKNSGSDSKKVKFSDVAGADEEKEELAEIVEFLKNPKKFTEMGARIPKGVLLVGPPGTGKTLLARAVAGEAEVPFFSLSGSDFVELYVGVGASRVRELFEHAKKNPQAIIFIDEIDAVGRHRGAGLGGGHDEREQTLNQLLVEMDGFGVNEGLIVIAATNRRDILDPALLRPGRFDRHIMVGYPDIKGREEILKVHSKNKQLGFDVDLAVVAKSTVGFSGADLENLMNEAALFAVKKGHKAITLADIEQATVKVIIGPEKRSKVVYEDERKLTAYHEAGHAVATYFCPTQDPVYSVSIIPRGEAGGYTLSLSERDNSFILRKKMFESLIVALGGRVAEALVFGDISTGAYSDIKYVTATARDMVKIYGFADNLGPIIYGSGEREVFLGRGLSNKPNYSEFTATEIDKEIKKIVDHAYSECEDILTKHRNLVEVVAKCLLKKEIMDKEEFENIMTGRTTMEDVEKMDEVGILSKNQTELVQAKVEKNSDSEDEETKDVD